MNQLFEFIGNHPFLFLALFIVLALLAWNLFGDQLNGTKSLNPNEVAMLINREDAIIVDVREEAEFINGHILEALNIPLSHLNDRLNRLEKYRDHPLVAVCMSGQRSASACAILKKNNFNKIYNLQGGIMAWQNASMPLNKGREGKDVKNERPAKSQKST